MTTEQILEALYARIAQVNRATDMRHPIEDEFEMGINCRLANEHAWLNQLIYDIERQK